ncbi:DNA polymerase/3'-5' exonuclease PolX [Synoicihabitans lomoniglobus]|uniref:DNA polymerase beta n=1 Tax=Synoicihabitans lomoniglobus TaxID=2909285 RepID=A0AAF0I6W0_9BACT|nr:DNA polymerase/3'-5' exonuclease PolX [Opitutaceae bacterium LMO-M01]WED66331.1 DNA polymerase/3'-5' exonuclease PolX [Opitutaceae bacterium LMO-M01]
MTKNEIAERLEEIAVLLELKGENPFKIRAYGAGARVLESLETDEFEQLVADEKLDSIKGVGTALAQKIGELHATGELEFLTELRASIAPGLVEMLEVPGLGAKKIKAIHDKLGVDTIAGLAEACADGRVADLAGFGAKSQEKIAEGIRNREAYGKRHLWWLANEVAQPIVSGLRARPEVERAEAAGSLRRGMETVGDLDFIVGSSDPAPVMTWFCELPEVKEITARGETKSSVRFESGLQADLRIVPPAQFVFALHHFTGSKDHNVAMRQRALERGKSLSEWGLVPAKGDGTAKEKAERGESVEVADEAGLFGELGMSFVPPALREGLGEIEAAEAGELPSLVALSDLKGAFHNHTTSSDGRNTLAEMVAAAEQRGWAYLGIADHSKASFQANGLDETRLRKQIAEIRELNGSGRFKTHVFAGSEVDILTDGALDFSDELMAELDYVVASVHNALTQSEADMTKRIIRAVENPHVTMLGHPTGRLLLRREASKADLSKIIDAAIANDTIIELNASPWRLDLDWRWWRKAADRGLICAINPDAHECDGLDHVAAGINSARKGWLQPHHILNTRSLKDVRTCFARKSSV